MRRRMGPEEKVGEQKDRKKARKDSDTQGRRQRMRKEEEMEYDKKEKEEETEGNGKNKHFPKRTPKKKFQVFSSINTLHSAKP